MNGTRVHLLFALSLLTLPLGCRKTEPATSEAPAASTAAAPQASAPAAASSSVTTSAAVATPPASASALPAGAGTPLKPLDSPGLVDFYTKLAATRGANITADRIKSAVDEHAKFKNDALFKLGIDLKLPMDSDGSFLKVYDADVDNDGKDEFVVMDTNPVGMHNSSIEAVFAKVGDKLTEKKPPAQGPMAHTVYYVEGLERVGASEIAIDFSEGTGTALKHTRYVWKGTTLTPLGPRS